MLLVYSFSWEKCWGYRALGCCFCREVVQERIYGTGNKVNLGGVIGMSLLIYVSAPLTPFGHNRRWILNTIVCIQEKMEKNPGISVNRVLWSPDGSLFGITQSFCSWPL